jgi:DNA polymerase III alpha subunit (gram-positive type)
VSLRLPTAETARSAEVNWVLRAMVGAGTMTEYVRVMSHFPSCPNCDSEDLITITMTVSGRDLAFTTCHVCETKWWHRDGENVPLQSVIGMVVEKA